MVTSIRKKLRRPTFRASDFSLHFLSIEFRSCTEGVSIEAWRRFKANACGVRKRELRECYFWSDFNFVIMRSITESEIF